MQTPDTTIAQRAAWIATLIVGLGIWNFLDLTDAQKGAIVGGMIAIMAAAHTFADAYMRAHRVPLAVRKLDAILAGHEEMIDELTAAEKAAEDAVAAGPVPK